MHFVIIYDYDCSGFSIIWPALCQYNVNTIQISELVQISEQPVKFYCTTLLQTRTIKKALLWASD